MYLLFLFLNVVQDRQMIIPRFLASRTRVQTNRTKIPCVFGEFYSVVFKSMNYRVQKS